MVYICISLKKYNCECGCNGGYLDGLWAAFILHGGSAINLYFIDGVEASLF